MNFKKKRRIKVACLSISVFFAVVLIVISVAINFIFTPDKLTPVVLEIANKSLNAQLKIKKVELTFFSTFPRLGLLIEDGILVSPIDSLENHRTDSLLSFKECKLFVNPLDFLKNNKISIDRLSFKNASVYAFRNQSGRTNWNILKTSPDSDVVKKDSASKAFDGDIDIRNVRFEHTNIVVDDRYAHLYSKLDDANLSVNISLKRDLSSLDFKFNNKNILVWRQGKLLINKVALALNTEINVNHQTHLWNLKDTRLKVNGIEFDVNGSLRNDTVRKSLTVDLSYGMHAPSLEKVLKIIPKFYLKDHQVHAKGSVSLSGHVKGVYGNKQLPTLGMMMKLENVSLQYDGFPYKVDLINAVVESNIDWVNKQRSYVNIKKLRFHGAHSNIIAEGKVNDVLGDPLIDFNTTSTVDLDALAKTFPFRDEIMIRGKLGASLKMKCALSSLKKRDLGRLKIAGKLDLQNFELKDTKNDFHFLSNAKLVFRENETLHANIDIRKLMLKSRLLSSDVEQLSASVSSANFKDKSQIVDLKCDLVVNKCRVSLGDSLRLYMTRGKAEANLLSNKLNVKKPTVNFYCLSDSLFVGVKGSKLALGVAGVKLHLDKDKDGEWKALGTVAFDHLFVKVAGYNLPIFVRKTIVSVDKDKIKLNNASVQIGRSNLKASGHMSAIYEALKGNKELTAHLSVQSDFIDCNQLIQTFAIQKDQSKDTASITSREPNLKLFVVPDKINFQLQTNIRKVVFDKMTFENINGEVNLRNQSVFVNDLSMKALDSQMKATLVYKAKSPSGGYTGFDLKIKDINIGKLVGFIPALDTIVPMLRSFKGHVRFDVAAEARLDSQMNIRIPTLRSAIHIKGDSLVLMDGETFAEISKMMMFKNKKENVFDSVSVNVTVDNGNVIVYPFLVEIDRYKAAIGGSQSLDMNFDYHISILKSPLPFKAGVNIRGNLQKMKFRIGKAKYKDAVTPASVLKVDSTRLNMGKQIVERFRKIVTK